MEVGSKVRVLLVDDQPNVRRTLCRVLQSYPNIEVIGEASDGDEAVVSVGTLRPTVVVLDIKMNKMDGITATRLIKTRYPDVLVLGFSAELKDYEVNAMQQAGAFEVLTIGRCRQGLIRRPYRGRVAVNQSVPILEDASLSKQFPDPTEVVFSKWNHSFDSQSFSLEYGQSASLNRQ